MTWSPRLHNNLYEDNIWRLLCHFSIQNLLAVTDFLTHLLAGSSSLRVLLNRSAYNIPSAGGIEDLAGNLFCYVAPLC